VIPRLLVLALLLLISIALTGCGHKPSIVGKWQGIVTWQDGTTNTTFDFTQDGKETINCLATRGSKSLSWSLSGTYTVNGNSLDGNSLTQTITTGMMDGISVPIPPDQARPQTVKFTLDGDQLTLPASTSHKAVTLTQVKTE